MSKCPFSHYFHKISFREFRSYQENNLRREDLERKLKLEENGIVRLFHFLNYKIRKNTIISNKDKFFTQYCAMILIEDIWNNYAKKLLPLAEEKNQELFKRIRRSEKYSNLSPEIRENIFLNSSDIMRKMFKDIYGIWEEQFRNVEIKNIKNLNQVELALRLRNSMDRLFGNNFIEDGLTTQFIEPRIEMFFPLVNQRGLNEESLDKIIKNTIANLMKNANRHVAVTSSEFNANYIYMEENPDLRWEKDLYYYDKKRELLELKPESLDGLTEILEIHLEKNFKNQSRNQLGCPALFVKDMESHYNVLKELFQYKFNLLLS